MNRMHEANRKGWDAASPHWQAMIEERVDWRKCPTDPTISLSRQELGHLGDVSGKDVVVLGSGDNLVVFALAGMGARVTSIDISQKQLDTAAERATELGLDALLALEQGLTRDEGIVATESRFIIEACKGSV